MTITSCYELFLYPSIQAEKKFVYKKWKNILVGDILELNLNDVIPADIVLLESSDENEMCFIETANLDGETNLKQKRRLDIQFENLEEFTFLRANKNEVMATSAYGSTTMFSLGGMRQKLGRCGESLGRVRVGTTRLQEHPSRNGKERFRMWI